MRQVCIPRYGPPEVLRLQDAPEPPLTPADVRIAVHASGVNFADLMARQGLYPDCPKPPVVVGYEVAGRVIETGAEATGVAIGQRVVALPRLGGYADQVVVPWRQVFALPDDMPFTDAAALPVNYLTAYLALYVCGHLQAGECVLIHGAGGGILSGPYAPDGRAISPLSSGATFDAASRQNGGSPLGLYNGMDPNGVWTLYFGDFSGGDTSTLVSWSLDVTPVPEPTTWGMIIFGIVFGGVMIGKYLRSGSDGG